MKDGSIQCWQAKYFTTSLSAGQWAQVSTSVIDAIDNHSNLKQYYISIPIDLADIKGKDKKSILIKWKEYVNAWEALCAK